MEQPKKKTWKERFVPIGSALLSGGKKAGSMAYSGAKMAWGANAKYNPYNAHVPRKRSVPKKKSKGHKKARRSSSRRKAYDLFDIGF